MSRAVGFRARQVAALTVTAATVAIATGIIHATLLVRTRVLEAGGRAEFLARTFYHLAAPTMGAHASGDPRRAVAADPALRRYAEGVVGYSPVVLYVAMRDEEGIAFFHSDPNQEGRRLASAETLSAFAKRNALSQLLALSEGNRVLVAEVAFALDGTKPFGSVVVAMSTVLLRSQLLHAVATSAFVAAGVVLVAFLASFLVANRLLAPLDRLRLELTRIDTGEGKPRLDLRTEADVGRLIEFFATLSDRVSGARPEPRDGAWVQAMLDGLADAILVVGLDRRVLSVNEYACRLLGKTREEIEGRPLGDVVEREHALRALVEEAIGRQELFQPRTVSVSVEGRATPHLVAAQVLRDGARVRGVMVTARDVERISRLGSQISESQKLAALGRLTSNVAHEIRSPLNALVIQTSLLRSKLEGAGERARRHLDVLEEEVKRLDRVIDAFLKFIRPEEIELESVDLAKVVREALDLMTARAEQEGIRVETNVPPDLPPVRGSADLLKQALFNLVANACDAMPEGGTLRVRAESPGEGSVRLIVEDTGVGIAPEALPRVFDLFHTSKADGSGIGLSFVYRIVRLHGGEVRVDSQQGTGTRVTISLAEGSD